MVSTALVLMLAAAPPLRTVAEESGYRRTGRYAEVEQLCRQFERSFPRRVRCHTYGRTPEGRPLLALVASDAGALDLSTTRKARRPVVFFQGGIHAGEIDGKDAGFLLLRELLSSKGPSALSRVTAVFVPVVNVDGHERFGPNHRPNQNGPEEMGFRVTSQNLNLNRDYAKADAPEMLALLALLRAWDPILYLDLHVTDGAKFQPDISVMLQPVEVGPSELRPEGLALREALFKTLREQGHQPLPFYPSFRKDDDPTSGFALQVAPPRFSQGYWSLRNRFAALVEIHSWKDYRTRVIATRNVVGAFLELAAENGRKWLEAAARADSADLRSEPRELVLHHKSSEQSRTIEFPGYAYTREMSSISGKPWIRYDDKKPQTWKVPYFEELLPAEAVTPPVDGYVVPAAHASWVAAKLSAHGIRFELLKATRLQVPVEVFRAESSELRAESYEGRAPLSVKGAWQREPRDIVKGSLLVPTAQPGRRLIAHLFEPTGRDSFLSWGFFNAHFEQKEYMEDYVAEEVARKMLEDPKVRAEFETKLREDPKFLADPAKRLAFFYRRHPAFDERFNLYPVYRLTSPLRN